ncbi:MAG: glycosyltransferase [Defluviitaleaceae bacterium]|nr:glycosyltransferase [Defluviitaleaceae bacterium]
MRAYNAKDTLHRAVDSVLNQTYPNLCLYLMDNASKDNGQTRNIVEQYAEKDHRVIPFYTNENRTYQGCNDMFKLDRIIDAMEDSHFFCTLDADDEYSLDFFEKALAFLEENKCDIVACGNDRVSAETGVSMDGGWAISDSIVIEGDDFANKFSVYLPFMYTIWGKLYSAPVLKRAKIADWHKSISSLAYGRDTSFALHVFGHANKVGVLGGSHHKYYISPSSVIHQFSKGRVASDRQIFDSYKKYLELRNGGTTKNIDRIYNTYAAAVGYTINMALKSDLSDLEKRLVIEDILEHPYTKEALARSGVHEEHKLSLTNVLSKFDEAGE